MAFSLRDKRERTCFPELSSTEHGDIQYETHRIQNTVRDSPDSKYHTRPTGIKNTLPDSKYSNGLTGFQIQLWTHNELNQYYRRAHTRYLPMHKETKITPQPTGRPHCISQRSSPPTHSQESPSRLTGLYNCRSPN